MKGRAAIAAIALLGAAALQPSAARAVSPSDFQPGRIIDDAVMQDAYSLDAAGVQRILVDLLGSTGKLDGQAGGCDVNGDKLATGYFNGRTFTAADNVKRRDVSPGNPAPFTCLANYVENPATRENNLRGRPVPAGGLGAAQIIVDAARANGISPKVLLVMLQKESLNLLTDEWPFESQYKVPMGYGCPDGQDCDAQFFGFANQVGSAAAQLRKYYAQPQRYDFLPASSLRGPGNPEGAVNVRLHPSNPACGTVPVAIANQATANLYNYTPFVPNAAALAATPGLGDACSSYGNRNFWYFYATWFGSSLLDCLPDETPMAQVERLYNPKTFEQFYTAYRCEANSLTHRLGYVNEGAAFNTTPAASPGAVPVYRLYNQGTGLHFWTRDQAEITTATTLAGFRLEGVAFTVVDPAAPGIFPVKRLYNPKTFVHFWTLNDADAQRAAAAAGFSLQGPAFSSQ